MYIISSLRLYSRNHAKDFTTQAGIMIFAAVCGYLIAAFFNDSVVSVAPVFWVLLGTGFSINHRLKDQMSSDSDSNWASVPIESGHLFRFELDTCSCQTDQSGVKRC